MLIHLAMKLRRLCFWWIFLLVGQLMRNSWLGIDISVYVYIYKSCASGGLCEFRRTFWVKFQRNEQQRALLARRLCNAQWPGERDGNEVCDRGMVGWLIYVCIVCVCVSYIVGYFGCLAKTFAVRANQSWWVFIMLCYLDFGWFCNIGSCRAGLT